MADKNNDKLLEMLFPEEWYSKVIDAINFAIVRLGCSDEAALELSKYIIDYNIEKQLNSTLLESAELLLPKRLNWSDLDNNSAFEAFNILLETFEICKKLNTHELRIKFGKNNVLYNAFLLWKEVIPQYFPTLRVTLVATKTKGSFILQLQRIKQNS